MTLEEARPHLTDRQYRVLQLRLKGHSWRTIGRALNMHEATARGHHNAAIEAIARAKENAA